MLIRQRGSENQAIFPDRLPSSKLLVAGIMELQESAIRADTEFLSLMEAVVPGAFLSEPMASPTIPQLRLKCLLWDPDLQPSYRPFLKVSACE